MSTEDISRFLFQPHKRYAGVRMQQGRVILDSDWNESERIDDEEMRRTLIDVICAKGTFNEGFLVGPPSKVGRTPPGGNPVPTYYDFTFRNGSFYLGGLRFESQTASALETFLAQDDWLQIDAAAANLPRWPQPQDLHAGARHDLVYLRGWEQCVTAVEDSELRERALGGPDTSVRIRRMRRIAVLPDVREKTCAAAFNALKKALTAPLRPDKGCLHGFDETSGELKSKARLTVAPDTAGITDDPCKPAVPGGYLGADNQTIRIQLTAPDTFIWGFDNAAPLYRVQVEGSALKKIKFLTLPRDQVAQPLKGQTVELIPWGALLPNQEKVAEFQGQFFTVETSYDPMDNSLTISPAVLQQWVDWFGSHKQFWSKRDPTEKQQYFYLRLWTGGTGDATGPTHTFTPGMDVPLGQTGLKVKFSNFGLPGDFWIIAARPNTPQVVVPWELLDQAPPFGPRYFFAPLALIHWTVDNAGKVQASVQDCRKTFRPLCDVNGCCTITVGDGKESFGDVNSIQQAVDLLPPEEGGEVCVLRGEHYGPVLVRDRSHITIHGCGPASRIVAEPRQLKPLITIHGCRNMTVRSLSLVAVEGSAIELQGEDGATLEHIALTDLEISARDRSAIIGRRGRCIVLRGNRVSVTSLVAPLGEDPEVGQQPAVFLTGDDLVIEGNHIVSEASERAGPARAPFGGLHIGGGSNRVDIRGNVIAGGNGNGITLGSFRFVHPRDVEVFELLTGATASPRHGISIHVDANGCVRIDPNSPPPTGDDDVPLVPMADEALADVRIIGNDISGMGANGISVVRFFDLTSHPDFITVDRLTIEDNRIHNYMLLELGVVPPALREHSGYGGIALADGEYIVIRHNAIEHNGTQHLDPICGVFILYGEGVTIDGNRILHNSRPANPELVPLPGQRGGIVIAMAQPRKVSVAPFGPRFTGSRQDGVPAARIHDNVVVALEGRALKVVAIGPVTVEGNQLTAHGSNSLNRVLLPGGSAIAPGNFALATAATVPYVSRSTTTNPLAAFLDALGGAVVAIVNLGVSNEIYLQLLGLSGLGLVDTLAPGGQGNDVRLFVGGNILFNDNQVVLDAFGPVVTLSLSSVLLFSLDDVSMTGNQCDCDLVRDFVGSNALVFGWSLRVSENRFKEGVQNALLSALTLGLMNSTTDNQGTHCFVTTGASAVSVTSPNRSLVQFLNAGACNPYLRTHAALAQRVGIVTPAA